ncbi:MAG: tripartite tricarboxylate transporter TctB family protein [Oscillospiraceae bacterium]|nr:tripartite tricarboxylate transporter TctB family protein [Oscillospiraceae bacterium]
MSNKQYKLDIIPGIVLSLFAAFYLLQVPKIVEFKGLGSTPLTNRFVPYLWGGALLLLSLWILVRGIIRRKKYLAEGGRADKNSFAEAVSDKREVIASFISLTIYVALMGSVGFVIMTLIYVFVQILILTPRENWKKTYLPALITAAAAAGILFYVFRYLLNVLLPVGVLSVFGL